jgi:hypothetical protein
MVTNNFGSKNFMHFNLHEKTNSRDTYTRWFYFFFLGGVGMGGGWKWDFFMFPMCVKEGYCETNNVWHQELLRHYNDPKVGGIPLTKAQGGSDKVWFHIWGMSLAYGFQAL